MKAIVQRAYGSPDVLEFTDIEEPTPKDDEVLVSIHAASANPADWHFMRGEPYFARLQIGLRRPRKYIRGYDLAGRVEAVGKDVTRFRPGDEVFADNAWGAFAEYACVREDLVAHKPANLTFEQSAAVPLAALTALQGLRDRAGIEPGQRVLIIGASGGVGTFAVQIAKSFGAEVTGVCSTRNVDMVRSIGADHVIDYTREDFAQNGKRYDLVFQLAGTRSPGDIRRSLAPKGKLLLGSGESSGRRKGPIGRMIKSLVLSPFVSQKFIMFLEKGSGRDLETLKEMIEAGSVTPVIDRNYPLSDAADAVRYVEQGHSRGKVVISVNATTNS